MLAWPDLSLGYRPPLKTNLSQPKKIESQTRRYSSVIKVHRRRRSIQNDYKVREDPLIYSMIKHEKSLNAQVVVSLPQLDKRKTLKNSELQLLLPPQKETIVTDVKYIKNVTNERKRLVIIHRPEAKLQLTRPKWFDQGEQSRIIKRPAPEITKSQKKPLRSTEATNDTLDGWNHSSGQRWHQLQ